MHHDPSSSVNTATMKVSGEIKVAWEVQVSKFWDEWDFGSIIVHVTHHMLPISFLTINRHILTHWFDQGVILLLLDLSNGVNLSCWFNLVRIWSIQGVSGSLFQRVVNSLVYSFWWNISYPLLWLRDFNTENYKKTLQWPITMYLIKTGNGMGKGRETSHIVWEVSVPENI